MTCPHGMPTPASCVECMEDGPVTPTSEINKTKLPTVRCQAATFQSQCKGCNKLISVGDVIGLVEFYGWCCAECAECEA